LQAIEKHVRSLALAAAAVLLSTTIAHAGGDAAAGQKKAVVCKVCHGIDGVSKNPLAPNISGQIEGYLSEQLKAFRAGERKNEQMSVIAKGLSDDDIANLAAWYSAIKITVTPPQ
jgi:cytochrome c553